MDNQIKTSEAITIRYIPEDAQRLRAEAKRDPARGLWPQEPGQ